MEEIDAGLKSLAQDAEFCALISDSMLVPHLTPVVDLSNFIAGAMVRAYRRGYEAGLAASAHRVTFVVKEAE